MPTFDDFWALLNFFYFPASRLYLALVVVGTTVPNQNLFISASFWWLLAQLEVVLIFGGNGVLRRCWWLVLQCRYKGYSLVPIFDESGTVEIVFFRHCCTSAQQCEVQRCRKECYSTMTTFDNFWESTLFFLRRQWFFSALLMASTTVPIQRLFISANFWWLLALLKMVFFFGGNVVLRHCWGLVQQRRKEFYSTMPTFDNFAALLNNFLFSGGNIVLRRCWWPVLQCGNKGCSLVPILDDNWHCWKWFSFVAAVY